MKIGLAASGTEANRKIDENAVKVDGALIGRMRVYFPTLPARLVVRLGKRAKIAIIA